ncbi:hypothetical protein OG788_25985 [Streptomyces sp. NBC_00647]|uniref:hypothetical protein n=1 Tax=Streptomyces sp. NBC_00647 TaxID=2975796 RepID=UPI003247BA7E
MHVSDLAARVRAELEDGCDRARLPFPQPMLGPGRAIVRPGVVAVSDGIARVLVRRESPADMSRRDVGI